MKASEESPETSGGAEQEGEPDAGFNTLTSLTSFVESMDRGIERAAETLHLVHISSDTQRKAKVEALLHDTIGEIKNESARYNKVERMPWISATDGSIIWPEYRIRLSMVLRSQKFELAMGTVIIFNLVIILVEADKGAECFPAYRDNMDECPTGEDAPDMAYLKVINMILQILYTMEASFAIFAGRSTYFKNNWNNLDFFVVCTGWLAIILKDALRGFSPAFLRIFRVARLLRAFRVILAIRECYMLISGLAGSLRAMFFGLMLLLFMLFFWAILLVSFAHEPNTSPELLAFYEGCDRCPRAYESVYASMLTLFQQIVAGDSWGLTSLPVMEHTPQLVPIFVLIVMSVALGVMNLILAVIVDSATEARENDVERKQQEQAKRLLEMKITLLKLCSSMDADYSGSLTLEELKNAWSSSDDFRNAMAELEIGETELQSVFKIMDPDQSGEVDYREFVDSLYDLKTNDNRMSMALMHADITSIKRSFEKVMPAFDMIEKHDNTLNQHNVILQAIDAKLTHLLVAQGLSSTAIPGVSTSWI